MRTRDAVRRAQDLWGPSGTAQRPHFADGYQYLVGRMVGFGYTWYGLSRVSYEDAFERAARLLAKERNMERTPQERIDYLETALRTIAKREGRYSRDPMTHAENTIDDMAAIAEGALAGTWEIRT